MIYFAIAGWLLAIAGWWGAWNVFQNLKDYVKIAQERERLLIQDRLRIITDLQKAMDAAAQAYAAQTQVPSNPGNRTLN